MHEMSQWYFVIFMTNIGASIDYRTKHRNNDFNDFKHMMFIFSDFDHVKFFYEKKNSNCCTVQIPLSVLKRKAEFETSIIVEKKTPTLDDKSVVFVTPHISMACVIVNNNCLI